jgi:hypothetical protein
MKFVNSENHIKINNGSIELSVLVDTGLGTWISFLSYALENFHTVRITETRDMPLKNLKKLIDTFNLNDRVIIITSHKRLKYAVYIHDYIKSCSTYIKFDTLNFKNNSLNIEDLSSAPVKPTIGIAMYGKKEHVFDQSNIDKVLTGFPWCRYYSIDEWSVLIKKIKLDFGYDIITLDNIEEFPTKVLAMVSMCDAIVCYEGGMAHLAHTLGIPTFILPWRDSVEFKMSKPYSPNAMFSFLLHLDKKSYFLNSIEEMTEWNAEEFRLKINQLKREECGNNPLLNNNQDIDILLNMARGYLRVTQTNAAATFGLDSVLVYLFSKIERPLLGGVLPMQIILK